MILFSNWLTPWTTWSYGCLSFSANTSKGLAICGQTEPQTSTWGICLFSSSIDLDQLQTILTLYSKAQLANTVNPTIRLPLLNEKMMQIPDLLRTHSANLNLFKNPNVFGTLTSYQQTLCWIRYHLSCCSWHKVSINAALHALANSKGKWLCAHNWFGSDQHSYMIQ